jgi:hypothetical protein
MVVRSWLRGSFVWPAGVGSGVWVGVSLGPPPRLCWGESCVWGVCMSILDFSSSVNTMIRSSPAYSRKKYLYLQINLLRKLDLNIYMMILILYH